MGTIKYRGKSVFDDISTSVLAAGASEIGASEIANGAISLQKSDVAYGTIKLDGTAEGTISHTLGRTPNVVNVVGVGGGSCLPFFTGIGSTKGTLTCSGTGTAYWSLW